jgi:hypothetical protein
MWNYSLKFFSMCKHRVTKWSDKGSQNILKMEKDKEKQTA